MAENPGIKEGDKIFIDGRKRFVLAIAKSGFYWGTLDHGLVNTMWNSGRAKFSYWASVKYRKFGAHRFEHANP